MRCIKLIVFLTPNTIGTLSFIENLKTFNVKKAELAKLPIAIADFITTSTNEVLTLIDNTAFCAKSCNFKG